MNVENLAGNQYINFSLISLTELPSGVNFINILHAAFTLVGRSKTHKNNNQVINHFYTFGI